MKILILLPLLVLASCAGMPNPAIVEEVKFCEDHGLRPEYIRNLEGRITNIQCGPKANP